MAAVGGGTFFVTLLIGLIAMFTGGDEIAATLDDVPPHVAQATIDELSTLPAADRTALQSLQLGDAYARLGLVKDALEAYEYASKIGEIPAGSAALDFSIKQLGNPLLSDIATRVIQGYRGGHVDDALRKTLESESLSLRRNGLRTMQRRGSSTVTLQIDVAILNLLTSPNCEDRKSALLELGNLAAGDDVKRTLEAIGRIEERIGNVKNSCMSIELDSTNRNSVKNRILTK